jgi:hypothetical protein
MNFGFSIKDLERANLKMLGSALKLIFILLGVAALSSCGHNDADVNAEIVPINQEIKKETERDETSTIGSEAEAFAAPSMETASQEVHKVDSIKEDAYITEVDDDSWSATRLGSIEVKECQVTALIQSEDHDNPRLRLSVKYPQIRSETADYSEVNEKLKDIPSIIGCESGYDDSMAYFEKIQNRDSVDNFELNSYYEIKFICGILISLKLIGSFKLNGQGDVYNTFVSIGLKTGEILPLTDFVEPKSIELTLKQRASKDNIYILRFMKTLLLNLRKNLIEKDSISLMHTTFL